MTEERLFVAGRNRYEDHSCPAICAGRKEPGEPPNDYVLERGAIRGVVGWYDFRNHAASNNPALLDESTARESWLQAIEDCEDSDEPEAAEIGREVARELGWL